jgi:hypothetical protein
MSRKSLIWLFMIVGSTAGGFLPYLWGSSALSMSSVLLTALGGIAGIWLAFKVSGS